MATLKTKPLDTRRLLSRMASVAFRRVAQRVFPPVGGWTRDVNDQRVRPLTREYRWYKSGTRPYQSAATRRRAVAKRAASGLPGPGALVRFGGGKGGRRRLGRRSTTPDSRLSERTARALGVVERGRTRARIGFRTAAARRVAIFLQRRNRFFPLTKGEEREVLDIARRAAAEYVRSVKVEGGVIVINLR